LPAVGWYIARIATAYKRGTFRFVRWRYHTLIAFCAHCGVLFIAGVTRGLGRWWRLGAGQAPGWRARSACLCRTFQRAAGGCVDDGDGRAAARSLAGKRRALPPLPHMPDAACIIHCFGCRSYPLAYPLPATSACGCALRIRWFGWRRVRHFLANANMDTTW